MINIYTLNNSLKICKAKLVKTKWEIDHLTIIVGDVYTYPITDGTTRQKIIKDMEDLNNIITQLNLEHSTQWL